MVPSLRPAGDGLTESVLGFRTERGRRTMKFLTSNLEPRRSYPGPVFLNQKQTDKKLQHAIRKAAVSYTCKNKQIGSICIQPLHHEDVWGSGVLVPLILYSIIMQLSTQQIRNKYSSITVLIFVCYVYLLQVSIQLDHHQAIFIKYANLIEFYVDPY
jgi:hypothetical protein